MALEAISNSHYSDSGKATVISRTEAAVGQETKVSVINISEEPSTTKLSVKGEARKEKGMTINQGQGSQKDGQAIDQQVKDAVSQVNSKLKMHRTRCEFSYHEETKRVMIKVLDNETNELIREIPPEQTLEMVQKAWELAGFLVDEKR